MRKVARINYRASTEARAASLSRAARALRPGEGRSPLVVVRTGTGVGVHVGPTAGPRADHVAICPVVEDVPRAGGEAIVRFERIHVDRVPVGSRRYDQQVSLVPVRFDAVVHRRGDRDGSRRYRIGRDGDPSVPVRIVREGQLDVLTVRDATRAVDVGRKARRRVGGRHIDGCSLDTVEVSRSRIRPNRELDRLAVLVRIGRRRRRMAGRTGTTRAVGVVAAALIRGRRVLAIVITGVVVGAAVAVTVVVIVMLFDLVGTAGDEENEGGAERQCESCHGGPRVSSARSGIGEKCRRPAGSPRRGRAFEVSLQQVLDSEDGEEETKGTDPDDQTQRVSKS